MKNCWRRIKEALLFYYEQKCVVDVIALLIGVFIICFLTISVTFFFLTIQNNRGIAQEAEYVKEIHDSSAK